MRGTKADRGRAARIAAGLAAAVAASTAAAALFPATAVAPAPADREPWVVAFDAPAERAGGMAFDGRRLWLVERATRELLALDPATGEIAEKLPAPGPWPEGLAWDGTLLWVSDSEEKKLYGVNPQSRLVEKRFDSPVETPQGLAWDGDHLWLADGTKLHRISNDDGTTIVSVPSPGSGGDRGTEMLGLAWQPASRGGGQGWLWVADRTKDKIYRVSPRDGAIVDMFPSPGPYPVGVALVDGRLLVADRDQRRVDALPLDELPPAVRADPRPETVTFVHEVYNFGPGTVRSADVFVAIPEERANQTFDGEPRFEPEPAEIVTDQWGQRSARFHGTDLGPNQSLRVSMTVALRSWSVRWHIDPDRVGGLSGVPSDIRARYTKDGSKFIIGDPVIRDAVDEALGDERNLYWMVRRIARYIQDHLFYELAGGWNVAPAVLARGNGSCSEYTFVFLAMCHAAGIPARYVGSVVVRGDDASTDNVFHRWPEVYYPGYGWVPADAQAGDSAAPERQADAMMSLPNRFLVTTQGAGGSDQLAWNYNSNATWACEGYCKVTERVWGDWSPDRENAGVGSIAAGE